MTPGPWPALVKAALLGTERTGRLPPGEGPGAVGPLVHAVTADAARSPERVLLAAAAVLATARRAGRVPDRPAVEAPPPAPPVDGPEVEEDASHTLGALVAGTPPGAMARQLLPEWLEVCGATGRRVPSAQLPAVLDLASADRTLRPVVLGALGHRGRWLAAQRAEWRWAIGALAGEVPDDPAAAWAQGTSAERRALLAAVRAVDPAPGRSLVVSTWPTDKADDRAAFVDILATEVSMDDEPFLEERARLDRARDVRRAATAALAHLPGSRLAARMRERALAHVVAGPGGRLAVRLPAELPDDWAADGVERSTRRPGGERAWWLRQVVAAAPLDTWGPAPQAVAGAAGIDHGDALLPGWALAANRQRRADWAEALLAAPAVDDPSALLRVLDPPARAAWLTRALEAAPAPRPATLLPLCAEVPRPWPSALVQVAAGRAAALVLAQPVRAHLARPVLVLAAERADAAALPRFAADLAQAMRSDRRLDAELRRPLALAQLRQDLLAELTAPGLGHCTEPEGA